MFLKLAYLNAKFLFKAWKVAFKSEACVEGGGAETHKRFTSLFCPQFNPKTQTLLPGL